MTEFSVRSEESDVGANENVFDLKIQSITYDDPIFKAFNILDESQTHNIKTFVTLDFFINETQSTDIKDGTTPSFDTIFCFKNQVDNFYIKYLQEQTILAEVYAVRRGTKKTTVKIGEAKLPLHFLLN